MDKVFKFQDRMIPFKMSPVDIVIPCYNNHAKVSGLVESIFNTVHTNRYQISIVDDCSSNADYVKEFKDIPGVVTHRHSERRGYGECLSTALEQTKQSWILYAEPEMNPTSQNWLLHLGQTLIALKPRGIKMVGPRTDKLDDSTADVRQQIEKESFMNANKESIILEDTHLASFCFLCHRELFYRIGMPKNWTSLDIAKHMRGKGYGQAISGDSWVQRA